MKEHAKIIKSADVAISEAGKKIARIASERSKYEAARDAAAQNAAALRAKAGKALALAACGEGDQKAADALVAEAAAAAGKADSASLLLAGLDEGEAAAQATIETAHAERTAAIRAALDSHLDDLAPKYRQAADALVALHRRMLALYLIHRGMGDASYTPWTSETEGREFQVPALNHPAFADAQRAGPYGEFVYSARSEMYQSFEGRMADVTAAERDLLRNAGVPV